MQPSAAQGAGGWQLMEAIQRRVAHAIQVARRNGLIGVTAAVGTPLAAFLSMLVTVATCLCIWRGSPSYQPGVVFPAISELGVDLPQHRIYQVGFFTCGALLSLSVLLYEELVAPILLLPSPTGQASSLPALRGGSAVRLIGLAAAPELNGSIGMCQSQAGNGRWSVCLQNGKVKSVKADNLIQVSWEDALILQSMLSWAHKAAAGIALQGVFTLQREISLTCFVHWGGAILFMASAMQHGKAALELYDKAAKRGTALLKGKKVAIAMKARHFILTYSSVTLFMIPLSVQLLPFLYGASADGGNGHNHTATTPAPSPLGGGGESMANATTSSTPQMAFDTKSTNMMGLMQWGIIFQFAVFFCTYATDMGAAVAAEKKTDTAAGASAN